jgi:hypothetical protein
MHLNLQTTGYGKCRSVVECNESKSIHRSFTSVVDDDEPNWIPIPDLNRTDADVGISFLVQNSVYYFEPVHDPWYLAEELANINYTGGLELYLANEPVKVMGCAEQFRICNPEQTACTPYGGSLQLSSIRDLGLNTMQLATAHRVGAAAQHSSIYDSLFILAPDG